MNLNIHDGTSQFTHFSIECSEYWKQIIRACGDDDRIWQYPEADIIELIEHCVDNIQHGNTYAHTLMKWMRDGLDLLFNILSLINR